MNYTPHKDERDFIRALLVAPDDVAVTSAYSDWLADRGETERAEFMNLSMKLEDKDDDCEDDDREKARIRARLDTLIAGNDFLYSADRLCGHLSNGVFRLVRCYYADFIANAAWLFSTQPIERVWVDDVRVVRYADREWVPRLPGGESPSEVMPTVTFAAQYRGERALSECCLNYGRRVAGFEWTPAADIVAKHQKRKLKRVRARSNAG